MPSEPAALLKLSPRRPHQQPNAVVHTSHCQKQPEGRRNIRITHSMNLCPHLSIKNSTSIVGRKGEKCCSPVWAAWHLGHCQRMLQHVSTLYVLHQLPGILCQPALLSIFWSPQSTLPYFHHIICSGARQQKTVAWNKLHCEAGDRTFVTL